VHGPLIIRQCADRRRGVLRALKAAGLDPEQALVDIPTSAQTATEGEACVEQLLSASIKPTAVFCANDLLALGLMRGLIKRGLSIPDDMALVGYDDVEFASVLSTPLTSVRQPKYELGRAAAELLLDEANNPDTHQHQHIVYKPELIIRESSKT
jgi:LacI family transcriptional regulator